MSFFALVSFAVSNVQIYMVVHHQVSYHINLVYVAVFSPFLVPHW